MNDKRIFAFTTKGSRLYDKVEYREGDVLLFGSETSGLPMYIHNSIQLENQLRVPMKPSNRSLNLSNTVAIVSYTAWAQFGFAGGK
jgi:tRNA (cytidine/uridine-2'-O-)-methyltransferase